MSFNFKPIRPVPVDTSCCAGYKEFTFHGVAFPELFTIYNSTASNYIHGEIESVGLQAIRVTFPSLVGYVLDFTCIQIIGTTSYSTSVTPGFNGNNTVEISWDHLGTIEGVFTVRIWMNHLTPLV